MQDESQSTYKNGNDTFTDWGEIRNPEVIFSKGNVLERTGEKTSWRGWGWLWYMEDGENYDSQVGPVS